MRSFAILAAIYAATLGTASALRSASFRTQVDVDATGYDTRTSGNGCSPNGCVPENTRDGSMDPNSRWSCKGDILDSSDDEEGCCITYSFEDPVDIVRMMMSFHKGLENVRTVDVYDNGNYLRSITSSGKTLSDLSYSIDSEDTEELKICLSDPESNSDVWLSITEVEFLVL